ncbi:orotidine-5'-phosphate decarboxylase [Thermoproteota archaeon]
MDHSFCKKLSQNIKTRSCYVCLGLDPDLSKIPDHYSQTLTGLTDFLLDTIKATKDLVIAYKPNLSFFEAMGIEGLRIVEKVRSAIPEQVPMILDAKRGDIGNTSAMQARYIFDYFGADAITLHPYMGRDSLAPFFNYKDKYHFILALTSNPSAMDFQKAELSSGGYVYEKVINTACKWREEFHNIGFVIGATQKELSYIRKKDSESLFLIPGVGAQGGSYSDAHTYGRNKDGLVLINMSRSLLYCSKDTDYLDLIRTKIIEYKH